MTNIRQNMTRYDVQSFKRVQAMFLLSLLAALSTATAFNDLAPDFCFPPSFCYPADPYRSYDGTCNNLFFKYWGSSKTYYSQVLKESLTKDFDIPPDGDISPNPRYIRKILLPDSYEVELAQTTVMFYTFAQTIAHDTLQTQPKSSNGSCCSNGKAVVNDTCISFNIPPNDDYYSTCGKTCQSIIRAKTSQDEGCTIPTHQRNGATAFLDLSNLYGNDQETALSLRAFTGGLLLSIIVNGKEFCPIDPSGNGCTPGCDACFFAGDNRQNQNLPLNALQHIFLRVHNSICRDLTRINPCWDDELLYQECKKITIAIYQKISFYDWLPHLVGSDFNADCNSYNFGTNPNTFAEFNFCFRQYHSLVRNTVELYDNAEHKFGEFLQKDHFNCPSVVIQGYLDSITLGATIQASLPYAKGISVSIGNHMFQSSTNPCRSDLGAIDLSRSFDFLQGSYCNLIKKVHNSKDCSATFKELVMEQYQTPILQFFGGNLEDVQWFYPAYFEKPVYFYGKTCQKIASSQFYNWKCGDRFWYEFYPWFTYEQLAAINQVTLSDLICAVTDINEISKNVFIVPSAESNPKFQCSDRKWLDLNLWKSY